MSKKFVLILALIILLLFLTFPIFLYYKEEEKEKERAISICIETCKNEIIRGRDLINGPCLLDPIEELPNWVCDIAHSPRQEVDNFAENQCSSFIKGNARHFVEVSPSCELIRVR
ncbi:MAG: hypothetical protein QXD89_01290 [Candidatus Aenigmatarchaeota archaeon]